MQGTRVRALVREDPTCRGATKPVRHNYWAHEPQLLKPACLEPMLRNKRSHHNEKPAHRNEEWPRLTATRESPRAATKTQRSQRKLISKWNKYLKKKRLLSSMDVSWMLSHFLCLLLLKFSLIFISLSSTQCIFSLCLLWGMDWVSKTVLDPRAQEKY